MYSKIKHYTVKRTIRDYNDMLSFALASLAGVSLGLLGGGGSILTVPILVYSSHIPAKEAIAMSLAVVGITTMFGVLSNLKSKNINLKIAMLVALSALPGTFLGSYLSQFISGNAQLLIFSAIMILAAIFMLKGKKSIDNSELNIKFTYVIGSGAAIGIMTGLIGVGGGFLIVPSLMYFTGLPVKKAVGTSLFIISFNSICGFLSYMDKVNINWVYLWQFTIASIIGIFIGSKLINHIPQKALERIFAVFLMIMGVFLIFKNISSF